MGLELPTPFELFDELGEDEVFIEPSAFGELGEDEVGIGPDIPVELGEDEVRFVPQVFAELKGVNTEIQRK